MDQYTPETLKTLRLPELRALYTEATGETTRCPNKTWLARQILAAQEAAAQEGDSAAETAEDTAKAQTPDNAGTPSDGATTAPDAADDNAIDPWLGHTTVPARITLIRAIDSLATLDELTRRATDHGPIQARVKTELAAHRKALAKVDALATDRTPEEVAGLLKAALGNSRTHARPGLLHLVYSRLQELDPEAAEQVRLTPLAEMSIEALRATYEAEVGRPTDSSDEGYLVWKIREARKGKVRVGPARRRTNSDADMKVVPIRIEATQLGALDAAWKKLDFPSRVGFIREALADKLAAEGEVEAAEMLRAV